MANQMGFDEYQRLADRTYDSGLSFSQGAMMAALGLAGETGEVIEMIKKWQYHHTALRRKRIEEELGDVLWYLACMASRFGISLQEVAEGNIMKLLLRHPKGFEAQEAEVASE